MATLALHASGPAPASLAWERYAVPDAWSRWAPQIQGVDTDLRRIAANGSGTVRAGLLPFPTLPVPFTISEVDEEARQWTWEVRLGPLRLGLEHSVTGGNDGARTDLRLRGPLPLLLAYAPLAQLALRSLVGPER